MRFLTAGESHGKSLLAILEGFPKGLKINSKAIDLELTKRMSGPGRGKRMAIEQDRVEFLSGLRNKVTLGSPIAMRIENKDARLNCQGKDEIEEINVVRPAHADLAGALKYNEKDINNILERASARETAARVCVGAICKQFLALFGVRIASYVKELAGCRGKKSPKDIETILAKTSNSALKALDLKSQKEMLSRLEKAAKNKDTLGGVIEIWADSVIPGLGSFMHFDQRLDAKLAAYLMSIPAVKGVEIGAGFEYARKTGLNSHDAVYWSKERGFYRKTNNSGGIEGGISNGQPIVASIAMKPIATLSKPLDSVNIKTKKSQKAAVIRSDTSAVVACSVVAESMCAIALTEGYLDKFGRDSISEITRNYKGYCKAIS